MSKFTQISRDGFIDITKVTHFVHRVYSTSGRNSLDLYILSNAKPVLVTNEFYDSVCEALGTTPRKRTRLLPTSTD